MAYLVKKCWTAPMPKGAEIVVVDGIRTAKWKLRSGAPRTAEVIDGRDGKPRIRGQTRSYVARTRGVDGSLIEKATGCRDVGAARTVLAKMERRVELVRAGVVTAEEDASAEHATTPLTEHIDDYTTHLRLKGGSGHRIRQVEAKLRRLFTDCSISRLGQMKPAPIEAWLGVREREGMASATRNEHRLTIVAFANWAQRTGRIVSHNLGHLPRADQHADRRHVRRALTTDELQRLLAAAAARPLEEALMVRRGRRRGQLAARVKPEVRVGLERLGRERGLILKCLALTGLRVNELRSITVSQVHLDDPQPSLELRAADEKSRRGATIPLRQDLADDLRRWLHDMLMDRQASARRRGVPIPERLPSDEKMLRVPTGLIRLFDRDLEAAAIPKRDDRGRVVDVHSLRVSFCSHMAKGGVSLTTAQRAMRHSTPTLTSRVYVDERMLDIAGALDVLPRLDIGNGTSAKLVRATG